MPKQLLIDGHSLLFRAYHALPPLTRADGSPTGALYGFANMLLKVIEDHQPDRTVVAFDAPHPTFRHRLYPEYKGTRAETPDEFKRQLPFVEEFLDHLLIPRVSLAGYEADDLIGTLSRLGQERGYDSEIITGDRDLLQLISDRVTIYLTQRVGMSGLDRIDREACILKMGVSPEQIPDLKGLMGDPSDNIRGVSGIGEKSAVQLISQYGSIDAVYQDLMLITNARWRKALESQHEEAITSRDLATIDCNAPIGWPEVKEPLLVRYSEALDTFLATMEMDSLRRRFGRNGSKMSSSAAAPADLGWEPDEAKRVDPAEFVPNVNEELTILSADRPYLLLSEDGRLTEWPNPLPQARYIGWSTKALLSQLEGRGESVTFVHDGEIQAYLLDAEARAYTLADVAASYGAKWQDDPEYQIRLVRALIERQAQRLVDKGLEALYRDLEMPLIPVLAHMESHGIGVDGPMLRLLGQECESLLGDLQQEIYQLADCEFNINSTQQLAEVLFDRLKLPVGKKTKTGYSTDADTLEKLRPLHPIIDKMLSYRQLMKIKGTYVDGMINLIGADGKIHTTFHQTVAATGRLSSSDPNLQNIPVREKMGRRVRGVFVPSQGNLLSAADYSQIELRMLAHLSADDHLIQAFQDGEDIHRRTAAEMFNIPLEQVDSTWRNRAKAINFGIIYGISGFGLARDTGVSAKEASAYIDRYYGRYPRLKQYFDEILEFARHHGEVSTILGRVRPLPDILHKNRVRRQYAERMAINTVIQGSAADLIKSAMVAFDRESRGHRWKSLLTLQVHDELIWDMVPEEEAEVMGVADRIMTSVMPLSVPLVVELKHGPNWEQMTAFALEAR